MKSCLVVYYSRSGMTRRVAEKVATACDCELDPIQEAGSRAGAFGFLRSGFEALTGSLPPILPALKNPADYELVILGTPVWAGNMSSPMRSYIERNLNCFQQVAAFCTMGGSGGEKALAQIGELCGRRIIAQLVLNDKEIDSDHYLGKIGRFVREIAPEIIH